MKKTLFSIISVLIISVILCSCASGAGKNSDAYAEDRTEGEYYDYNGIAPEESKMSATSNADEGAGYVADGTNLSDFAPVNQKLVYTTNLSIETKTFDESYSAIMTALSEAGGYIEYKELTGGTAGYSDYYRSRYAYMTLKIPSDKYEEFLAKDESFGNITNQNDSCDNITSQYVDTESRLAVLEAQRDQLLELMDRATSMEDIITIQTSLTEVVYQIENSTAQIRTYDNLVAYCTVTITLNEVISESVARTLTFGDRLSASFGDSLRTALEFVQGLIIALVYVLPYAVVGLALFFIIRAGVRKNKAKKLAEMQKAQKDGFVVPLADNGEPQKDSKKK